MFSALLDTGKHSAIHIRDEGMGGQPNGGLFPYFITFFERGYPIPIIVYITIVNKILRFIWVLRRFHGVNVVILVIVACLVISGCFHCIS